MQEAEIGMIMAPGQPSQRHLQDPISTEKKLGVPMYTCHPSYGGSVKWEDHIPAWAKSDTPSLK
jgi:hypothetical protein